MVLCEWEAPEGDPGQSCVHLFVHILSTSFSSVSIFSVYWYSRVSISMADTLSLFHLCPICTLWEKPYDSLCLSLSNADDVTKVDILRSRKGRHASYTDYGAANLRWGAQRQFEVLMSLKYGTKRGQNPLVSSKKSVQNTLSSLTQDVLQITQITG